jgi:hypothetical protein
MTKDNVNMCVNVGFYQLFFSLIVYSAQYVKYIHTRLNRQKLQLRLSLPEASDFQPPFTLKMRPGLH